MTDSNLQTSKIFPRANQKARGSSSSVKSFVEEIVRRFFVALLAEIPVGYQDEGGFHFGELPTHTARLSQWDLLPKSY
jgi:hypothetical protein